MAELVVSGVVHNQEAGLNLLSGMLVDVFAADKVQYMTKVTYANFWYSAGFLHRCLQIAQQ